jgi:YVTN family beta-propeller protein
MYVGLEKGDALAAIDTSTNRVVANMPIGQAPQAIAYVPNAVSDPSSHENLQSLGVTGEVAHLSLVTVKRSRSASDERFAVRPRAHSGLTGFRHRPRPKQKYILGLAEHADGGGPVEPLVNFTTNPVSGAGHFERLLDFQSRGAVRGPYGLFGRHFWSIQSIKRAAAPYDNQMTEQSFSICEAVIVGVLA